jgi:hypothetical protein
MANLAVEATLQVSAVHPAHLLVAPFFCAPSGWELSLLSGDVLATNLEAFLSVLCRPTRHCLEIASRALLPARSHLVPARSHAAQVLVMQKHLQVQALVMQKHLQA